MNLQEFTERLRPFAYNDLGVTPPLTFRNVSARVFPIRANLDVLQQLCDSYLNIVPAEAGRFRVPFPYVNLVVLDYGEMGDAMRAGWFSQVEVYFGLTVEWYKQVRGQWVFHDWGVITPYIFVNDDVSVPIGRMVYGFPKVLASVELNPSQWLQNPLAPTTLARISTTVFPRAYAGGKLEQRVFLEVQRASMSNVRVPIDTSTPNMPWTMASNLASAWGGLGRDAMWLAQAMRISSVNPLVNPNILPQMLARLMPALRPDGSGYILNSLNVKQFRRAEDPTRLCYRALTNGCLKTTGFNRAGLLGEQNILLGDLSGGYSIQLYEHSSLPIAQTFGLEVQRSWSAEGVQVAEFRPVMPFWVDVDLKYDRGTNVAWQTTDGVWKDETGKAFHVPFEPKQDPEYENPVATTIEAISGPFQFTGTAIRVIPLLAERATLQNFVEEFVNDALKGPFLTEDGKTSEYDLRFEVWARGEQAVNTGPAFGGDLAYVYLTASSYSGVISGSDNVGDWAKYELSFMVPVKWQRRKSSENGKWETVGVGLVPAFTLADNCITAFSRLEIQGIVAGTAQFVRPQSVWLGEEGRTDPKQTLLRVDMELLPALGQGQKASFQPAIEISKDDPEIGLGPAPDTPWRWAEDIRHELGMKKAAKQEHFVQLKIARALSLELLGNQTPFSIYALKQIRDVTDPNRTCYQSLVRVPRVLREVFDLEEIEETLAIRFYGYPSFDVVKTLGLKAARLEDRTAGIAYTMQGLRPFFMRATVDEPLAPPDLRKDPALQTEQGKAHQPTPQRLLSRAGAEPWTIHKAAFETMLTGEGNAPKITVDMKAETLQDQMDPSRTEETMLQARQRWEAGTQPPWNIITPDKALAAVEIIDPQTVIESILSREWSNTSPQARWRKGREKLLEGLGALPQGGDIKPYAEAELYRQINNGMAARVGSVAAPIFHDEETQGVGGDAGGPVDDDLKSALESTLCAPFNSGQVQAIQLAAGVPPEVLNFIRTQLGAPDPASDGQDISTVVTWVLNSGVICNQAARRWLKYLTGQPDALAIVSGSLYAIVFYNLLGSGSAMRWREEVKGIIESEIDFTTLRLALEGCVDMLAPVAILGIQGIRSAYDKYGLSQKEAASMQPLAAPQIADMVKAGDLLFEVAGKIAQADVQGEPSPHNNLDTVALAQEYRLKELLASLQLDYADSGSTATDEDKVNWAKTHSDEMGEMVNLARAKCQVQYEALINKLSRAWQKPDFCLRRDGFSAADRDRLLPVALSWDEDWYYGDKIILGDYLAPEILARTFGLDERQSSRAGYPPVDESAPPAPSVPASAP